MKSIKRILLAVVYAAVCMLVILDVAADAGGAGSQGATSIPPELSAINLDPVAAVIMQLSIGHPWILTAVALIGFLRFLIKPIVAGLHWYFQVTGKPVNEGLLAKAENSPAWAAFFFALDWLGSLKLRKAVPAIALGLLVLGASGCSNIGYLEVKHPDGSVETRFFARTFFDNNKLSKLAVARRSSANSTQGLALGAVENDVNTEAIKAAGDLVKGLTAAAVSGAIEGAGKAAIGKP